MLDRCCEVRGSFHGGRGAALGSRTARRAASSKEANWREFSLRGDSNLIGRYYQAVLISVASDVIRLLADPMRARIVEVLASGPACVCHLVDDIGATQPNVSNHVRVLRQAGIIEGEPRGRYTFYRLVPDALEAAATGLSDLAALARTTERDYRECP